VAADGEESGTGVDGRVRVRDGDACAVDAGVATPAAVEDRPRDVRDGVPEAVDDEDLTAGALGLDEGVRKDEVDGRFDRRVLALREGVDPAVVDVGGGGREDVAAVEGRTRGLVDGDLVAGGPAVARERPGGGQEDAVVGADERVAARRRDERRPIVATAGSTTTRWTAGGNVGRISRNQNAAVRTSCRGKSWATSTSLASVRLQMTPRIAAGYGDTKSVASVITAPTTGRDG